MTSPCKPQFMLVATTAIDFNHKHPFPSNTPDSTEAIIFIYRWQSHCVQDTSDNTEIIKYFSLSSTIEIKKTNCPLIHNLQQNHINMQKICARKHSHCATSTINLVARIYKHEHHKALGIKC